ncbi:MAG: acyl-CoA dehydrogenase family protein [Candidatus Latescibacteria bacterium]|nr:acyl-CoA dehydrogenase family protein [Candidatus Latescibacterota bacterium]
MTLSAADARDLARDLAAQFATRAAEADRRGKLPAADVRALRESGYAALAIPREYGGADLDLRACTEAQLELAQGSGSTALVAAMQLQVTGNARLNRPWDDALYERLCRDIATTGALCNSIASEPEIGSPSRGQFFATTAEPSDGGYRLNGRKTWSTGGRHLSYLLVGATLGDRPAGFLVEADRPGIEWVETWGDGLALRAADNHDVYFNDTQIPADHLLDKRDSPYKPLQPWAPMMFASVYLGIGLAARDAVIRYALERVPKALGEPIATLPKIQRLIGEIDMALMAARALLLEVAAEDGRSAFARIAAAKQHAVEVANEVTDQAIRIAGGAGVTRALPLERYFRDVRAGHMQPPNGDAALEAVGQGAISELTQ